MSQTRLSDAEEIFLGRIEEQNRFREALRKIQEESRLTEKLRALILKRAPVTTPFIFLIYGEGGMGKSRLACRLRDIALTEVPFKGHFRVVFLDWEQRRRLDVRLASRDTVDAKALFTCLYAAFCDERFERHFETFRRAVDESDRLEAQVAQAISRKRESDDRFEVAQELSGKSFERSPRRDPPGIMSLANDRTRQAVSQIPSSSTDWLAALRDSSESFPGSELTPEERNLTMEPVETLGRKLAEGIHAAASNKPVIVVLDTYEIVDRADYWIREVIRRAGSHVLWVLAGRDNLAESRKYKDQYFTGYQHDFSSHRLRLFQLGEFSVGEVEAYFSERVPERPLDSTNAKTMHEATLGIPLAVREAAAIWKRGASMVDIVGELPARAPRQRIVKIMTERFLLHCLDSPSDQASLYALALSYDADPDLIAAMLQTEDLEADLSGLERRYSFVFVDQRKLHHSVTTFFREYLLQDIRRKSRTVRDINERAVLHLQARRQAHEAALPLLESRVNDDRWSQLTMGLVHHSFWVNEDKGWAVLMAAFWAGLFYDRGFARALVRTADPFKACFGREGEQRLKALQGGLRFSRRPDETTALIAELERWAPKLEDDGFGPERKCMLDLLHGQLLHENEKYEDAVAEYERVLQRLSQDTGTLRKQVGKAFEEAGWKLAYAKGSSLGNQDAERAYLRAISCQETADSCRRLARIQSSLGKKEDALSNSLRSVELEPTEALNHSVLGDIYLKLDRYEEAIAAHRRAIEVGPENAANFASLADLYDILGRNDDTVAACKKAIELDPKCTRAYITLSAAYGKLGRPDDEYAALRSALESDPNQAAVHYNLAEIHMRRGKFEDACRELNERIRLSTTNIFSPLVLLGLIAHHRGQMGSEEHFRKALVQWETAWAKHWQTSAGLLELRTVALLCTGKKEEALEEISHAIGLMTPGEKVDLTYWTLLKTSPSPPEGVDQVIAVLQQAQSQPRPTGTAEPDNTQGPPPR